MGYTRPLLFAGILVLLAPTFTAAVNCEAALRAAADGERFDCKQCVTEDMIELQFAAIAENNSTQTNESWFLPNAQRYASKKEHRRFLYALLELLLQREKIQGLRPSNMATALQSVMDGMVADACEYLREGLQLQAQDFNCSDNGELRDLLNNLKLHNAISTNRQEIRNLREGNQEINGDRTSYSQARKRIRWCQLFNSNLLTTTEQAMTNQIWEVAQN